jgi:hypothetical protein
MPERFARTSPAWRPEGLGFGSVKISCPHNLGLAREGPRLAEEPASGALSREDACWDTTVRREMAAPATDR